MRRVLTLVLVPIGFIATGPGWESRAPAAAQEPRSTVTPQQREAETARLNQWFDARFEEQLDFFPMEKTELGRKDDSDDINDFSESGEDAFLAWRRRTVGELRNGFNYAALTPEARISFDLWEQQQERLERAATHRRRVYLFDQMSGPQAELPQFLITIHRVDDAADMEAYIARIGGISRAIGQLLARAQIAAREGVRPPKFAYDGVLEQARALVTGAPFGGPGDAPLWADAKAKIRALADRGRIDAARAEALRAAAQTALREQFKPAYDGLIAWIESDMPNADAVATGVWKLPGGRAYYEERLAFHTTTGMTADEIHQVGLREVARIRTEMEAIRTKVGFGGTLPEFFEFVRTDSRFHFPDTDEGREAYLQAARDNLAAIERRLPESFGLLPKADLVVRRVEAFREQPGAAQHYQRGSRDGSRPGVYYAHLSDMRAMPKPEMESIAYHEGIPGHHMQISIAQELTEMPQFRGQSFFTAFTEGWALYAELLAKEMGAYGDPYSDFGRLTTEMWRAIRLVLDTGLHSRGWTEAQAVEYFLANSAVAEGQVRAEVRRYIVWPGQATAYKVGMLKILELREKARTALGTKFDIRGFHDVVLGGGALPLSILERRVNDWIVARKAG